MPKHSNVINKTLNNNIKSSSISRATLCVINKQTGFIIGEIYFTIYFALRCLSQELISVLSDGELSFSRLLASANNKRREKICNLVCDLLQEILRNTYGEMCHVVLLIF